MASRRQHRAKLNRLKNQEAAKREERELLLEAQRLRSLTAGFSRSNLIGKKSKILNPEPYRRESAPKHRPSVIGINYQSSKIEELTPEMQQRELIAQEEIKKKQMRVAVLYNKGGLQYITDEMDPTTFGRK